MVDAEVFGAMAILWLFSHQFTPQVLSNLNNIDEREAIKTYSAHALEPMEPASLIEIPTEPANTVPHYQLDLLTFCFNIVCANMYKSCTPYFKKGFMGMYNVIEKYWPQLQLEAK